MSCRVGCRRGLDPAWLWLWHSPVAAAPIGPLAWEPPYAAGVALEKPKRQKKETFVGAPPVAQLRIPLQFLVSQQRCGFDSGPTQGVKGSLIAIAVAQTQAMARNFHKLQVWALKKSVC